MFENTSYTFSQNKSYAITGSSGIGKSSLLHMLAGVDQPSDGQVYINNINFSSLPLSNRIDLLHDFIGLVFQQSYLIDELTVLENIFLKKIIHNNLKNNDIAHAKKLLQSVKLIDKANTIPSTLSGGQQQKVALLRAIFHTPQFLLADEPTGNLDEVSSKQVISLLLHYQKQYNMGVIITTHDLNIAKQCNYIVNIENKSLSVIKNSTN